MAAREYSTVFHNRMLRKNFLDTIGWTADDFSDFQSNLKAETYRPESLLLDLFVNGMSGVPDASGNYPSLVWWRERSPAIPRSQWFLAAVGYAQALAASGSKERLIVDFWERELESENLAEALAMSRTLAGAAKGSITWVCWSHSLLESWQREGMGDSVDREEKLAKFFRAQGWDSLFVPVTDPLGALAAARRMALPAGASPENEAPRIVVMPSFGSDKLVLANWYMKTIARYEAATKDSSTLEGEA